MSITVEQIRKERELLEARVNAAIQEFGGATGLNLFSIDIGRRRTVHGDGMQNTYSCRAIVDLED